MVHYLPRKPSFCLRWVRLGWVGLGFDAGDKTHKRIESGALSMPM